MDITKKCRRIFLKDALISVTGLATGLTTMSWLSACTSFDDYLFDDRSTFKDDVLIIGGGISGLYLAHKLRNNNTEFRLFEGANYFGGRIQSYSGSDYGASLLSSKDILAHQLVKMLSLQTMTLNKDFVYLPAGMQKLPDVLLERIIGLVPYRNFRLRWRLVEIQRSSSGFELVFECPTGQKHISCRKIALAIPPTQWKFIKGLLALPEMNWAAKWLETLQVKNTIKIVLPGNGPDGDLTNGLLSAKELKSYTIVSHESLNIRQIIKKNKDTSMLEIDVNYLISDPGSGSAKVDVSIDYIYSVLKKKLQLSYPFQKLLAEQFYDWSQIKLLKGSSFMNSSPVPISTNSNFQIVGDFNTAVAKYTIEGALQSATKASKLLL